MILYINTTLDKEIQITLKDKKWEFKRSVKISRYQDNKLLLLIDKLMKEAKIDFKSIKKIEVEDKGGSFTSLRVGVLTANALGYAFNIPVVPISGARQLSVSGYKLAVPIYDSEPNIGKKKLS
jgi:tRNA A37 threonylcarbamoyladenosine modification protein TsaB